MSTPLRLGSVSLLDTHLKIVEGILNNEIEGGEKVGVGINRNTSPAPTYLSGRVCDPAVPNRGTGRIAVAPLMDIGQGLWAWLGYREEWIIEGQIGNPQNYMFHSASITVRFGCEGNEIKPQIFRCEWAGWANWNGAGFGYSAGNAGHPHWHFDVLESSFMIGTDSKSGLEVDAEEDESENEFTHSSWKSENEVRNLILGKKLGKIHFPSAAAWWKSPPHCDHAHNPGHERDIQKWLRKTIQYLSSELNKL